MTNYIDIEQLIDALIDIKSDSKKASQVEKTKNKSYNINNKQLSVNLGIDRKNTLHKIASELNLSMSELTRNILDGFFDFYNDGNTQPFNKTGCIFQNQSE